MAELIMEFFIFILEVLAEHKPGVAIILLLILIIVIVCLVTLL